MWCGVSKSGAVAFNALSMPARFYCVLKMFAMQSWSSGQFLP